jgi:two-component sensor histidine kinase/CheY-like chemotaxis protein
MTVSSPLHPSPLSETASSGQDGTRKAKILIVDDDERTAFAVQNVLQDLGQILVVTHSGEKALQHLLHEDFAVILLDVNMPGMDGYEMAGYVRARKRTRHVPIVFLTALLQDDSHLLHAYSAGAVDLVFKPVDPFILRSKVAVFVDLYLKQSEMQREAELRHCLQEENLRVSAEKLVAEQALYKSREHQEAMAKAEAHQRTLIEELNHRVKNMLTVVNAMARQTLTTSPTVDVFADKFTQRIDALGRTYGLLSREQWGHVALSDIARESLEPYIWEDKHRVELDGCYVPLDSKTALALGIVFHELATNAVKHGALSGAKGKVAIAWTSEDADMPLIRVEWRESGVKVEPPARSGFGSKLIKLELTHELNGHVDMIYDKKGLRVAMSFPLSNQATVPA